MDIRAAEKAELNQLADVWYDGWRDAHAQIVPAELTRLRTRESFRNRLEAALPDVRVMGPSGAPVGLCIVKGDELYQLYVSAVERGLGEAPPMHSRARAALLPPA